MIAKLVPGKDVAGQDIPWIPRPKGFVRAEYEQEIDPQTGKPTYINVVYRAKGDRFDEVVKFFKTQLPKKWWQLVSEDNSAANEFNINFPGISVALLKESYLQYQKGEQEDLNVDIKLGKVNKTTITEVALTWSKPTEVTSSEEHYKPLNQSPQISEIKVPPQSIYYHKESINLGGLQSVTDYYYTTMDLDKIMDFLKQNIPEGYTLQWSFMDNENGSIIFKNQNGEMITINVEPAETGKGYTLSISKTILPTN